jgi:dolichol-phosphate mannosyltransferase
MKKNTLLLSVILPTFNEVDNIIPLIREICEKLKRIDYEIIVVDDDSPDSTANKVMQEYSNKTNIKTYIRTENPGLANSILFGLSKAVGRYICIMDTDFNHDPKDIPKMLATIPDADIVIGSRYIKGGGMENRLRHYLSLIYNKFIKTVLNLPTYDNLSGFFVADRRKILKLDTTKIFSGYGDYFIVLLYLSNLSGYKIKEIPVFYKNRMYGFSKSKFFPMFIGYSKTVLKLIKSK